MGRPAQFAERAQVTVRMERKLLAEAHDYAASQGISFARLVHLALREFLTARRGRRDVAGWDWGQDPQ